jgi:hypothetical protein
MSASELAIFDSMSRRQQVVYLSNAQHATWRAEALYPTSLNDGNGDAFRHTLFNAFNAKDLGAALAKMLGDAHENRPNLDTNQQLARAMDLHNNEIGRSVSGAANLEGAVINLLNSGALRIIENGRLVPSRP